MENLKQNVIKLLCENARYTNAQMAAMLGEDEKKISQMVKSLEKEGVIVKYSAILDTEVMAKKSVQALIEVKVAPQKLNGFDSYAEEIYNFDEVTSLYLMSGGFDLAVFVEGKSIIDVARFVSEKLSKIEGVESVQTQFVLKRFKIEGQKTRSNEEGERQIIQA